MVVLILTLTNYPIFALFKHDFCTYQYTNNNAVLLLTKMKNDQDLLQNYRMIYTTEHSQSHLL